MQKARRHIIASAPTACRRTVSGTISLPCLGYFSPFPYGTGSLSVSEEYLALPDGAGRFRQDFSGPALLRILLVPVNGTTTWLSHAMAQLSRRFVLSTVSKCSPTTPLQHAATVWAIPFSLATTRGITIVFFSSRYLDVSVHGVGFPFARDDTSSMYQVVPFGNLRI